MRRLNETDIRKVVLAPSEHPTYKTIKKFYPLMVFIRDLDNSFYDFICSKTENNFDYYFKDFLRALYFEHSLIKAFKQSMFYMELKYNKRFNTFLNNLIAALFCFKHLVKLTNRMMEYSYTKLIDYDIRSFYVRTRNNLQWYYSFKVYPFGYVKLERITFSTDKEDCINYYGYSIINAFNEEEIELKENRIILFKGFIFTNKQQKQLFRLYAKDLRLNEVQNKKGLK